MPREKRRRCSGCAGTGYKMHRACRGVGCVDCDWTGRYGRCDRCGGSGWVPENDPRRY